jgi:hypothetical protein
MKILRETIKDLLNFRKKLGKVTIHYKRDLATITSLKIQKYYMILPPTPRNVAIVENLRSLYPELSIVQECDPENRKTIDLLNILIQALKNNNITLDHIIAELVNNCIIIDRNEELDEYLDAAKVGNALAAGKRYVIKQIGFFDSQGPIFNSYSKCLGDVITKKLKENGCELEILYIDVSADSNVNITARTRLPLNTQFDQTVLEKISYSNNFKKEIHNEIKTWLSGELKLSNAGLSFSKYLKIHIPTKEIKNFVNKTYVKDKSGLCVELNTRIKHKHFETHFSIKKIPLDEFYNFVTCMIYNKVEVI